MGHKFLRHKREPNNRNRQQMKASALLLLPAALLLLGVLPHTANGDALIEPERVLEYHKRNYKYPVQDFVPNTTGWRDLMQYRLGQVREIPDSGRRYEA
jgi:hypothetical protein